MADSDFRSLALILCLLASGCAMPSGSDPIHATSPALAHLSNRFSGHWRITEHDEPGPGNAAAEDGTGSEDWFLTTNGQSLTEVYAARFPTRSATDTAFIWWDRGTWDYHGTFCASFVDGGCAPFDVSRSGNTITMHGEFSVRGTAFGWRETFAFEAADHFTQTLYQGPAGEPLALAATIHAVRFAPIERAPLPSGASRAAPASAFIAKSWREAYPRR